MNDHANEFDRPPLSMTAVNGAKTGAEFSDALRDAATKHYGHAGPLFIERLIEHYTTLGLADRLAKTLQEFGVDKLSAQDARVARSFAVIGLAGELAIEWDIVPWPGERHCWPR